MEEEFDSLSRKSFFDLLRDRELRDITDQEMLTAFLLNIIPLKKAEVLTKQLLECFGNFRGVIDADLEMISEVTGLPMKNLTFFSLFRETAHLYHLQSFSDKRGSMKELANIWHRKLCTECQEVIEMAHVYKGSIFALNSIERIAIGSPWEVFCRPRELINSALRRSCSGIVLCHNHLNGCPTPSIEDEEMTKKLTYTFELIDVRLIDHLIVSRNQVYSINNRTIIIER
jgi:DNA repair protein RadC